MATTAGTAGEIRFRAFRNKDVPALIELAPHPAGSRGPGGVGHSLMEEWVLSSPLFDAQGLIVAEEEGRVVGFIHGGFGPNDRRTDVSRSHGFICWVAVRDEYRRHGVGHELVAQCEKYLLAHGASDVSVPAPWGVKPFYLGFHTALGISAVESDKSSLRQFFEGQGYGIASHTCWFSCDLQQFRPVSDREQLLLRRQWRVTTAYEPVPHCWWDACTLGDFHRIGFQLVGRGGGPAQAHALFYSPEPVVWRTGERAVTLSEVFVEPAHRAAGLATFLLGEAFRRLSEEGFSTVEAQVPEEDANSLGLLKKLRFRETGRTVVYRKRLAASQ